MGNYSQSLRHDIRYVVIKPYFKIFECTSLFRIGQQKTYKERAFNYDIICITQHYFFRRKYLPLAFCSNGKQL